MKAIKLMPRALKTVVVLVAAVLLAGGWAVTVSAQVTKAGQETVFPELNRAIMTEIIDSISGALNEVYVFPETARKMEEQLRTKLKENNYDAIKSLPEFTQQLTADLREISRDRHLSIGLYDPSDLTLTEIDTVTDAQSEELYRQLSYNNFDFIKVEWMPGNIGYMKFNSFNEASLAGETAASALGFLAHCDALIIDLRDNGGGSPSLIQFITSYFFEETVHLNSFYIRQTDSIQQFWTSGYVPGKKMTKVDLYVLTSSFTFSGAEEFTYNLKNLKRATIIGETTGGGAHPVEGRIFPNLYISMSLPYGRAINPISGTNWEGTGVDPDIKVPRDRALDVAYREAINKLYEKVEDDDVKANLEWVKTGIDSKMNPVKLDAKVAKKYTGIYGPRTIIFENGELYYQRENRPKYKMIPMSDNLFRFDELDYFRLEVVKDNNGHPVELVGHYQGGYKDISPRTDKK
nr:S41 family peptidase [candidate division Zixibacteria bacterium]